MVDQENNDRQTPLFVAVAMNDPAKVQLLINAGANLNTLAQVGDFIFYPNSNMADRQTDRSFKQLLLSWEKYTQQQKKRENLWILID